MFHCAKHAVAFASSNPDLASAAPGLAAALDKLQHLVEASQLAQVSNLTRSAVEVSTLHAPEWFQDYTCGAPVG